MPAQVNVISGMGVAGFATGVGIFVAIPAVVAYNIASKKIADIESNTHSLAKLLTAYLKTKDREEARRSSNVHYLEAAE
jgi:biopolymer transport protein ExbB/biopolymer transport protein TolQ